MLDAAESQKLADVFAAYPEIQAVYLFGSTLFGKIHAESDLDLAVVPRDASARARKLDILADLARNGFDNVDLVFLDTTDIVLKYEAVKYNHLIYQAPDFERGGFYSLIVRQYLDFLPYLRVQREAYKKRILDGQQEIFLKRLHKLDEYLGFLEQVKRYSYDAFICNPEHYGSAERFLHLAIEAINDIGNHIISDDSLGVVNWYSDIPTILSENGIITPGMEEKWIRMVGFRNTLVHEYIEIDRKIVYDVLQNNLGDIEDLKRVFAQYL